MKRSLLIIALLLSFFGAKAQEFYSPEEISVSLYQGNLADIGINTTNEVVYILPFAQNFNESVGASVTLSFLYDNKFLCLECIKMYYSDRKLHNTMRLHYSNKHVFIDKAFPDIADVFEQNWYNINFEDIFFDNETGNVVIPCSYGSPQNNYLIINLLEKANVDLSIRDSGGDDNVKYYNLNGVELKNNNFSGDIIIKKQGAKSEKCITK